MDKSTEFPIRGPQFQVGTKVRSTACPSRLDGSLATVAETRFDRCDGSSFEGTPGQGDDQYRFQQVRLEGETEWIASDWFELAA